jgi:hypothetical protein
VTYRLIYVALGLLAVAAIALGVVFAQDGDPIELSPPLESISPAPGSTVIRQGLVEVDLEVGYAATIYIDGVPIPAPTFVEATGVYRWSPHPGSPVMTEWAPGEHTVRVEWQRVTGTPQVGAFEWTFRVS